MNTKELLLDFLKFHYKENPLRKETTNELDVEEYLNQQNFNRNSLSSIDDRIMFADFIQRCVIEVGLMTYPSLKNAIKAWDEIPKKNAKNDTSLCVEFLAWCNTPVYRAAGELGFRTRVQPQYPEYNTYLVIDETGYSVLPQNKFLTTEELYTYWLDTRNKPVI